MRRIGRRCVVLWLVNLSFLAAIYGCSAERSKIDFIPGSTNLGAMLKTEKPPADLELKRRIQDLIDYKGGGFNQENVADIIENALKILSDVEDTGDVRVIQTAVRELRYAFRLFAPYSDTRKVT